MNIWISKFLYGILWILFCFFRYFSDLFPYKKAQKGLFYSRGTREADLVRRAQVAAPRRHTQAPTWHEGLLAGIWWAHWLVGPG